MITLTYVLLVLTAMLVVAAGITAFRDRVWAMGLVAAALVGGIATAIVAAMALNGSLPPRAYEAVAKAASEDVEVDAASQWALTDNVITPSEYGQIAEIYREKTGRELNARAK